MRANPLGKRILLRVPSSADTSRAGMSQSRLVHDDLPRRHTHRLPPPLNRVIAQSGPDLSASGAVHRSRHSFARRSWWLAVNAWLRNPDTGVNAYLLAEVLLATKVRANLAAATSVLRGLPRHDQHVHRGVRHWGLFVSDEQYSCALVGSS